MHGGTGGTATASNGITGDDLREMFAEFRRLIDGAGSTRSRSGTNGNQPAAENLATTTNESSTVVSRDLSSQTGHPVARADTVASHEVINENGDEASARSRARILAENASNAASLNAQQQRLVARDSADESNSLEQDDYNRRALDLDGSVSHSTIPTSRQFDNHTIPPSLPISNDVISQQQHTATNLSDSQNRTLTSSMEDHLAALRNGTACVKLNLKNLPAIMPNSVDAKVVTRQNIRTLSGVINLEFGAHSDYIQLKKLMQERTPSWPSIQANPAFQALCSDNPAFNSRVERMLAAEGRGFGFSDSNTVHTSQVNMTAGRNRHLLDNQRVL